MSLSDGIASLRAHNEEVRVAHGLVSLHRGYHRMLGHAFIQVWTYLAVDKFDFYSSFHDNCLYLLKKGVYICVFSTEEPCSESV